LAIKSRVSSRNSRASFRACVSTCCGLGLTGTGDGGGFGAGCGNSGAGAEGGLPCGGGQFGAGCGISGGAVVPVATRVGDHGQADSRTLELLR
jgi:hypothetical protein